VREPMATLTDDEYGAQLVENALTRSKAAKIAMVHLCECWEIDGTLGIRGCALETASIWSGSETTSFQPASW
jgi:hypothetical protein